MKQFLIGFWLLFSVIAQAQTIQTTAKRFYRVNDYLIVADAGGGSPSTIPYATVQVLPYKSSTLIRVLIGGASDYYVPSQFLDQSGTPYGSTVAEAITAFAAAGPALSGTGVAGVSSINGMTGPLTGVLMSTQTYSNPTWITALDPSRITQNSNNRLVSDSEKSTWNAKVDVSAVRTIAGDSARAVAKDVTFGTGFAVTTSGNSLTINNTGGGGGSSTTLTNNLTTNSSGTALDAQQGYVLKGLADVNAANIATNTASVATNNSAITSLGTRTTTLEGQATANASNIASLSTTAQSNISNIASLSTTAQDNISKIASLSALVVTLQAQLAAVAGTFTIQAPTLTVSSISQTGAVVTWGASTSATSYTLESATNSGFTTGLTTQTVTSGTTFTLSGLTAGTQYWLRIRASGGAGTTASGYGTSMFTTSGLTTLATPTSVSATAISSSAIGVSWSAVSNATSYTVRRSTSASMSSPTSFTTSTTSLTLTSLSASTQYYVDVSASASGFTTSATSATATATTSLSYTTVRISNQTSNINTPISTTSTAIVNNVTWNRFLPTFAQAQAGSGYSLTGIVTETGGATSLSATLGAAFAGSTGSSVTATVGNGLYPPEIQRIGLTVSSSVNNGTIHIDGIPAGSYARIKFYGNTQSTSIIQWSAIGATTVTSGSKTLTLNYGADGTPEDSNGALVVIKNIQPDTNGRISLRGIWVNNIVATWAASTLDIATTPFP